MRVLTLRTRFTGGFAALIVMVAALAFTAVRAMSSLNAGLDRVVHRTSVKADRIGRLVESLVEIEGLQEAVLLRSILSGTAGAEKQGRAAVEAERRIDGRFGELIPLLDSVEDRRLTAELQSKALAVRAMSGQAMQLIREHRTADAAKLVSETILPAYEGLDRGARDFLANRREKMNTGVPDLQAGATSMQALAFVFAGLTLLCSVVIASVVWQIDSSLGGMGSQVAESARQVARAATRMGAISRSLVQGASEQAVSLEQAASERVNQMVEHNAQSSREAAVYTNDANRLLAGTDRKLEQMLVSCDISRSNERISKVIRVIEEIAFQTNILSLNAAVEAAKAGDAGLGFAVVADEFRNLAQRCSRAARDTSALIEESVQHSRTGQVRLNEVAGDIRQVAQSAAQVRRLSNEVNSGCEEQARAMEQISRAILRIREVTRQTTASAEEGGSAGSRMSAEAEHLQSAVQRMRATLGRSARSPERLPAQGTALDPQSTEQRPGRTANRMET